MSSSRDFRSVPPPASLNRANVRGNGGGGQSGSGRNTYTRYDDIHSRMLEARAKFDQTPSSTTTSSGGRVMFGLKRPNNRSLHLEDDYFERDDGDDNDNNYRQDGRKPLKFNDNDEDDVGDRDDNKQDDEEEEDPLDAFMADLEKNEAKSKKVVPSSSSSSSKQSSTISSASASASTSKQSSLSSSSSGKITSSKQSGVRQDIEEEDIEESYYRFMESNPTAGVGTFAGGSEDDEDNPDRIEYDVDGNPVMPGKKMIDPLPMIYHSQIEYHPFVKNFYNEHEEIRKLSPPEVVELRRKLGIRVTGPEPPKPVVSFAHFGFDPQLVKVIRKLEYTQPTPIQAQSIPAALAGRDLIGVAKTGSGKTAAFIWPLIVHIMDQPELEPGDGPIGVILAPTRELSQQIYTEAKRFAKPFGIRVVCTYGGGSKFEQSKDLEQGAEIVVGTPGRVIDFVKMKATNFLRCTYLVLDEADRMFDMGFEPQVRSICNHVRPDRQTLMFSATFKKKIEKLARDVLLDPIRIVQGEIGDANQDVTQTVLVFKSGTSEKWDWLLSHMVEFTSLGSVLVFVTKKTNCQELAANLKERSNFVPLLLHGDMNQIDRNQVITSFKRGESLILIATDVAARGLDIPHIRTVVNYDIALDIDTHTHRIGRTGRAGELGNAYTLVTEKDKEFVGHLVRNLESANQPVPEALLSLAMQSQWFRKSRFKHGGGKAPPGSGWSSDGFAGGGGGGGGKKARPGLGSSSTISSTSGPISSSSTFYHPHGSSSNNNNNNLVSSSQQSSTSSNNNNAPNKSSAGTSDRLNLMRNAYKSQFRSQFTNATDTAWKSTNTTSDSNNSCSSSDNNPTSSDKKKSRWT